jgi:predicted DNA-binding transcriptional regulator AlpA
MSRTAFGDLPELATRKQVAEFTQTSVPTLARWASEGDKGPKFIRLGGSDASGGAVRYRREDVLAWLASLSEAATR